MNNHAEILLCLAVCLVGGFTYFALTEPKRSAIATLGLWAFGVALLVTLSVYAGKALHL